MCYNKIANIINGELIMNQILITEKLYITPELKRKKKVYKFNFILSIFLVVVLISFYIYAEYDRNKSEETSLGIMDEFNNEVQEDNTIAKNNVLVVVLSDTTENNEEVTDKYNEIFDLQYNRHRKLIDMKSIFSKENFGRRLMDSYRFDNLNINETTFEEDNQTLAITNYIKLKNKL